MTTSALAMFRKILLIALGTEAVFVLGVILVAQIFHLDPNGESYWKEASSIALFVFLALVLPAIVLTYSGGYALVPATPLAALGLFMCLSPYLGWLFDYGLMIAPGIATALMLLAVLVVVRERRRQKSGL